MILSIFLIILFSFVPVVLWWYGVTFLSSQLWNRGRFLVGMFSGGFSVGLITLFQSELLASWWGKFIASCTIFLILFSGIWILTASGSPYIRVFLRKLALLHGVLFLLCASIFFLLWKILPLSVFSVGFFSAISWLIFSVSFEEGMKHLSTLWLSARSFRFSREDFLIFTLFVTLGFVSIENLIFLFEALDQGPKIIFQIGISRILFALLAHFFAASICVFFWWKALSYKVFWWKYSFYFLLGFLLAISVHTLFDLLVQKNSFVGILIFTIVAYMFTTRWMISDSQEVDLSKNL